MSKREKANQKKWEARFEELVDYKQVHGNCNVPAIYKTIPQLGTWVGRQRTKEETMIEEKRKRLNSIGFVWKLRATPICVPWEVRFQQLTCGLQTSLRKLQCTKGIQNESKTKEMGHQSTIS